jgi:hypothetical protein
MSSGNFILGNGLPLENFNLYVKPCLERYKAEITDCFSLEGEGSGKRVLVSLIGDANSDALEQTVKISLDEARKIWSFMPYFETIGLYQDNNTASKVFQNLAVKYSAWELNDSLEDITKNLKNFSRKFDSFK